MGVRTRAQIMKVGTVDLETRTLTGWVIDSSDVIPPEKWGEMGFQSNYTHVRTIEEYAAIAQARKELRVKYQIYSFGYNEEGKRFLTEPHKIDGAHYISVPFDRDGYDTKDAALNAIAELAPHDEFVVLLAAN